MIESGVAIAGAGPSGLIAAETLARAGLRVTVFERMASPARKFLMAGRGGLNLTHSAPIEKFLMRYGDNSEWLQSTIKRHPPDVLLSWAHGLGQETFVGTSGRVFPKAMKASPLLRAWLTRLAGLKVDIKLRHTWTGFAENGALEVLDATQTPQRFRSRATILALGGASWPRLGSDARWLPVLQRAGVAVMPLQASNCGILVDWSPYVASRFAGEPLKRVAVSVGTHTSMGDLVITRQGLEGGPVYSLGPVIRHALAEGGHAQVALDLKPGIGEDKIAERLARARVGETQSNALRKALALTPAAIAICRDVGPLPADPRGLAHFVKNLPVTTTRVAPIDRAISTAGGISASSLDDNLMLKALPGVFAAGEMLDWDAPTGGYLLQASFATGVAAANGVLKWLAEGEAAKARQGL